MNQKPLRLRRLRLVIALAIAVFGAVEIHSALIGLFSVSRELPITEALIGYGAVFAVAYLIAPKWG